MDLFLKFTIVIPSTCYNLFHTYSGPFPTKKHKATTHPIPDLFQQRKYKAMTSPIPQLFQQREHKATINYSAPIPTKKLKATAHLFRTLSNKENTKQQPGTEQFRLFGASANIVNK